MASVERHGKAWRAVYQGANGKRSREALPARTKAEAKELAAKLERRAWLQRRGLDVGPEELTGTLASLVTWWLENRCPAATRDIETSRIEKHVTRTPSGTLPLGLVTPAVIDELLHKIEANGGAPASVNKMRALLHTAFARAKKADRWVGENSGRGDRAPSRAEADLFHADAGADRQDARRDPRGVAAAVRLRSCDGPAQGRAVRAPEGGRRSRSGHGHRLPLARKERPEGGRPGRIASAGPVEALDRIPAPARARAIAFPGAGRLAASARGRPSKDPPQCARARRHR